MHPLVVVVVGEKCDCGCGRFLCVPYVGITSLIPLHFGLGYCPFPSESVIQGFLGVLMCGREKVEGGEGGGGDVRGKGASRFLGKVIYIYPRQYCKFTLTLASTTSISSASPGRTHTQILSTFTLVCSNQPPPRQPPVRRLADSLTEESKTPGER